MVRFLEKHSLSPVLAALSPRPGARPVESADPSYTFFSWLAGSRYTAYDAIIDDLAKKHGLDPLLIKAIVWRESAFHPDKSGLSASAG